MVLARRGDKCNDKDLMSLHLGEVHSMKIVGEYLQIIFYLFVIYVWIVLISVL